MPFIILILLWSLSHYSQAQEGLFELSLEQLMNIQVSTVSKANQTPSHSAASITVFSHEQIQRMGIESLEQLLVYVPGFHVVRDTWSGDGFRLSVRGRSNLQPGADLLILYDGMRLNDTLTGGAFGVNRFLDVNHVQQVEVIRGPASSIYGGGAFAAVVNIISQKQGNKVGLAFSDHGAQELALQMSRDVNGHTFSLATTLENEPGQSYQDTMFSTTASTTQDPRQSVQLLAQWQHQASQIKLRHSHVRQQDFYIFGSFLNNDINEIDSRQTDLLLLQEHALSPASRLQLQLNFNHLKQTANVQIASAEAMQNLPPNVNTLGSAAFWGGPLIEEENAGLIMDWHYKTQQHQVLAGFEWRQERLLKAHNLNNYELEDFIQALLLSSPPAGDIQYYGQIMETRPFAQVGSRQIRALFAQDIWQLQRELQLTLALRYDQYDDVGSHTSPQLGLVHQMTPRHSMKLLYGQAFLPPNIYQLSAKADPTTVGNPQLKAQVSDTWQLGWQFNSSETQHSLTYFHRTIKDLMQLQPVSALDPRNTFINQGSSSNQGLEWQMRHRLNQHWESRVSWTHLWQASQEVSRNSVSYALNHQQGAWQINVNGHGYSAMAFTASQNDTLFKQSLPGYWLHHLHLTYQWQPRLQLQFTVHNLLDRKYRSPSLSPQAYLGFPNTARRSTLAIEYQF